MASSVSTAVYEARKAAAATVKPKDLKPSWEAITKAFSQTSRDGSGLLRTNELQVAMRSLGFDMSKDNASHLVQTSQNAKEGGAGGINFDQFLELVEAAAMEAAAHKDLSNTFQLFKEEKQLFASSRITLEDLLRVRDQTMPHITNQEVADMYRVAKSDNVAGIDIDEFCAVLNKKGYFIPPDDN